MVKVLGIKKMMSQVYNEKGFAIPVTVIDLSDVYFARGGDEKSLMGMGKKRNPSKPDQGQYKDLGYVPQTAIEVDSNVFDGQKVGDEFSLEKFDEISKVDVIGISKGKGFQGVVKRWGFAGGPKTHGQSDRHRSPGSIGSGTTPGRVLKGKKMGGRMGNEQVTVKNLDVVKVDKENKLVMIKGAVPGPKGSVVEIRFCK